MCEPQFVECKSLTVAISRNIIIQQTGAKRSDTKGKVFSPLSSAQKSEVNEKVYGFRHRASPASSFTQLRSTNLAPYRHANTKRTRYINTHTMEKYYGKDRLSVREQQFVDCKSLTVVI